MFTCGQETDPVEVRPPRARQCATRVHIPLTTVLQAVARPAAGGRPSRAERMHCAGQVRFRRVIAAARARTRVEAEAREFACFSTAGRSRGFSAKPPLLGEVTRTTRCHKEASLRCDTAKMKCTLKAVGSKTSRKRSCDSLPLFFVVPTLPYHYSPGSSRERDTHK